jgi:hypothetical protein
LNPACAVGFGFPACAAITDFMPRALLALFTRALREDVRAKSMYWARAGLVAIVLCQVGFTNLGMGWAGAPGLFFFQSVIGMNLLFISLAGLSYFSSLSPRRRKR